MKRTERHHLKDNELVELAAAARQALDERRSQLKWVGMFALALLVVGLGIWAWRARIETRSSQLLADALVATEATVGPPPAPGAPPAVGLRFATERERNEAALAKFKLVADQYPSSQAGIFGRYREGAIQMALGNTKEAAAAYQLVVDRAGDSLYGQMARLGLADAQARQGQFDQAIAAYKALAEQQNGTLPLDGILIQLARTYLEAGKSADAEQTYSRIVSEFPMSPFTGDAERELQNLKKT